MRVLHCHVICFNTAFRTMECSICLSDCIITNSNKNTYLHCGHVFHTSCISQWFIQATTCPLCRKDVGTNIDADNQMCSILRRFNRILMEYATADTEGERLFKKHLLYEMIRKHYLMYDERVCIAMSRHGIEMVHS